jgi:hypothetical protein
MAIAIQTVFAASCKSAARATQMQDVAAPTTSVGSGFRAARRSR